MPHLTYDVGGEFLDVGPTSETFIMLHRQLVPLGMFTLLADFHKIPGILSLFLERTSGAKLPPLPIFLLSPTDEGDYYPDSRHVG